MDTINVSLFGPPPNREALDRAAEAGMTRAISPCRRTIGTTCCAASTGTPGCCSATGPRAGPGGNGRPPGPPPLVQPWVPVAARAGAKRGITSRASRGEGAAAELGVVPLVRGDRQYAEVPDRVAEGRNLLRHRIRRAPRDHGPGDVGPVGGFVVAGVPVGVEEMERPPVAEPRDGVGEPVRHGSVRVEEVVPPPRRRSSRR